MKKPLIISIVLVVVLTAGILWYVNSKSAPVSLLTVATSSSNISTSTATTSTPTKPTTKPDTTKITSPSTEKPVVLSFPDNHLDTSDWQIYRNEEFGFEVKYPREWEIHKLEEGDLDGLINKGDNVLDFVGPDGSTGIRVFIGSEAFSVVRDRKIAWADERNLAYRDILINGIHGFLLIRNSEGHVPYGQYDYMFGNDIRVIAFENVTTSLNDVFQKMLLSFQLVK